MDYSFTKDEELFRETVREFCQKNIAPVWVEIDKKRQIPADLYKKMGEQGLFAIPVSAEYGGPGGNMVLACIAIEEIAYADPSVAVAVYSLLCNGWPMLLQVYGTEAAKKEILPHVAKGEGFFGIATTESHTGSDLASHKVTAAKDSKGWVLNGEKMYISGVGETSQLPWGGGFWATARTGTMQEGHRALTAYALLGKKDGKMLAGYEPTVLEEIGRGGLTTGGFTLKNYRMDDKYRCGEVNQGFYLTMEGFNLARTVVAAATIGAARWGLDQAADWFKQRKSFGRYISNFEGVSFKFAELYTKLEAAKYFVYKTAWLADKVYMEKDPRFNPRDLNIPASMAKMYGPEVATEIFRETMKWYGAYAYSTECPLYRAYLGCFSYEIGAEGAQNIMRYIIARDVVGQEYVRW
jgi:acyl-CoA dehydrogenase